ncbi:MAG: hypothetical protein ACREYF_06775 [Gammaproteobacteria bacterium]
MLYVANARGRGAGPNLGGEDQSPKHTVLGTVNIIPVPSQPELAELTERVYANNGFIESAVADNGDNPIPAEPRRSSGRIKRDRPARYVHYGAECYAVSVPTDPFRVRG